MIKSSIFLLATLLLVSCASTQKIEAYKVENEFNIDRERILLDRDLKRLLDCWFVDHSEVCFRNHLVSNSPILDDEDHFKNAFRGALYDGFGAPYRLDGPQIKRWFRDADEEELEKLKETLYNFESIEEDEYIIANLSRTDWPAADEDSEEHYRLSELKDEKVVSVTFIAYGDGIQSGVFHLIMVKKSYSWLLWEYAWND